MATDSITLINRVLLGLRKDQLSTATTTLAGGPDYHKLVLAWINQAKEEVEEAWDWQALRTTATITGSASTATYTLDTAGQSDVDLGPRSKLLYEKQSTGSRDSVLLESSVREHGSLPQVWDTGTSTKYRLRELSFEQLQRMSLVDDNTPTEQPVFFALNRDADDLFMQVQPAPTAGRTWQGRFYDPQDELVASDITIVLSVPARAVWTLALAKANLERGEEIGRPGRDPFDDADTALANAIAIEQHTDDITGYPV